jgi:hypothetical protein
MTIPITIESNEEDVETALKNSGYSKFKKIYRWRREEIS